LGVFGYEVVCVIADGNGVAGFAWGEAQLFDVFRAAGMIFEVGDEVAILGVEGDSPGPVAGSIGDRKINLGRVEVRVIPGEVAGVNVELQGEVASAEGHVGVELGGADPESWAGLVEDLAGEGYGSAGGYGSESVEGLLRGRGICR